MMWRQFNPVQVFAGPGVRRRLGEFVSGGPALLVTSPGMMQRGTAAELMALCPQVEWTVRTVAPNPDLDVLDGMAGELRDAGIKTVVVLGGGSAMDSGKALAACLAGKTTLAACLRDKAPIPQTMLPLICLPSTAGTGAEVTPFATIWDNAKGVKRSLAGDCLYAQTALLDPELTLSLPWTTTLYCGLDVVSHALESLWNRHCTPASLALADRGLRLALAALPALEHEPESLPARGAMQTASLLAGLAISQSRTSLAHSMSYPFTLAFGVPHGLACAFTLDAIAEQVSAAGLWTAGADLALVGDIRSMLAGFDLPGHMRRFCTLEQGMTLLPGMITAGRADNFVLDANENLLRSILRKSLSP